MSSSNISNPERRTALTERQEAVLRLIARGMTNAEIAAQLGVTLDGVKWHVREILGKYQVESREEAAELWREQTTVGSRLRHWAGGLFASSAVRWGTGLAAIGGTGLAGAAALVNSLQGSDPKPEDEPAAAVAVATPDPATNDGLTLKIEKVATDDTLTTIEFSLEGRPELGRFASPAMDPGPKMPTLTDQHGAKYRIRSMGGEAGRERFMSLTFDPVPATTKSLTLRFGDVGFVAPAFEVPEGQRPPDPSATIAGPWSKTIVEIPRVPTASVPVDHAERPFGAGSIVIDEVLQTTTETVIRAHLVGWAPQHNRWMRAYPTLSTAAGLAAKLTGSRGGDGPKEDLMEFRFERVSGPSTLVIEGLPGHRWTDADIEANIVGQSMSAEQAAQFRAFAQAEAEGVALVEAYFAGQAPPTWTFTLP